MLITSGLLYDTYIETPSDYYAFPLLYFLAFIAMYVTGALLL